MEEELKQPNSEKGDFFQTLFLSFTIAHLLIDLILWGILYLPEKQNFLLDVFKGTGGIFFLMIIGGIGVSLISYILSITGFIRIIRKKHIGLVIPICIIVNVILLMIALYDPNSLYNFHT